MGSSNPAAYPENGPDRLWCDYSKIGRHESLEEKLSKLPPEKRARLDSILARFRELVGQSAKEDVLDTHDPEQEQN